ncbi:MAG: SUF system NifU family Fe-S cluster assembly protein [Candidatus Abawacabacteria bacterium RBG_16_42_10]|uniref:SUF system NifU family Fe-S cluster assembly protein n=1 Tax=Candidatus Abawacabacteria bacterium RBG_16_42_10 TaxID=1817814 RepID=A0A1F4XIW5_9BACT|nr:MAG: SUF system NifU family Fe-S cluster assembly protein [Candidatus Abawacabacteria bacterium RBG_16_42_10]
MNTTYDRNHIGDRPLTSKGEIYKENILDHYREPHHFGEMSNADLKHREFNPLCGDEITIYLKIEKNKVSDISFSGHGCAISQAAMSMLTDMVKGKSIHTIEQLQKEDILKMLGIPVGIVRMKCALLGLKTLHKCLAQIST